MAVYDSRKMKKILISLTIFNFIFSFSAFSQETLNCELQQLLIDSDETTLGEIRRLCSNIREAQEKDEYKDYDAGAISERFIKERQVEKSEFVLLPHKMNYILPIYSTTDITKDIYINTDPAYEGFKNIETQFQISFKFPLSFEPIFFSEDKIYAAFTLEAWWQVYAKGVSSPFRETNYTPEIFYLTPLPWKIFDGNTGFVLGIEHQSNGRSGKLSRSWNRVYADFLYERNRFVSYIRPWYRLPEDEKISPTDALGDDNPDINKYLGHGEIGMGYDFGHYKASMSLRGNYDTQKGSIRFNLTSPLYGRLQGYIRVFYGYGDSLIDYNRSQTRIGIGIALNDLF